LPATTPDHGSIGGTKTDLLESATDCGKIPVSPRSSRSSLATDCECAWAPTKEKDLKCIIRSGDRRGEIYGRLRSLADKFQDQIRKRYPRIPRGVVGYNLDELMPERGFNVATKSCILVMNPNDTMRVVAPGRRVACSKEHQW
jgi:hypothetical protein